MTIMIRQHTKFPPTVSSPGQTITRLFIHCPTANFGPLSKDSITNPMLITAFDAYLTPRSPGAVSLVHKYINLKEPYNQGIKEKVTTEFLLKKDKPYMKSPTPEALCVEGVFQIQSPICGVNFSNNILIT